MPPDDDRLEVIVDDGARYLPDHPDSADVVLIDGFDDGAQPEALCTQDFYDACAVALRPGGVMSVNFMAEDRKLDVMCQRLENSFAGRVLLLFAADKVNAIVLGLKDGPAKISWGELNKRATLLKTRYELGFDGFVESIRRHNQGSMRFLFLAGQDETA